MNITGGYLPDRMRERADKDGLCADHPIRCAADDVEGALVYGGVDDVRRTARAMRRLWIAYTGERLYESGSSV